MPLNFRSMSRPLTGFWTIRTNRQRPGHGFACTSWMPADMCGRPVVSKSRFWLIVDASPLGWMSTPCIEECGSFDVDTLRFSVRVDEGTSNS